MAQRFYLPASGTAPASPAFDSAWDDTASAAGRPLVTSASNTTAATVTIAETSTTNGFDVLARQFVSDVLPAGTISGTFSAVIMANENNTALNAILQIVLRVVSGDGSTIRGTLYAGQTTLTASSTAGAINQEFALSTLTTRIYSAVSLSSVTAQSGDRIVAEFGYRAINTSATSMQAGLRFGDQTSGSDFALSAGTTTPNTDRPWIEFSQDVFTSSDANLDLAGTVPAVTAAFDLSASAQVSLAGNVPAVTAAFTLDLPASVSLAGVVPPVTGSFTTATVVDASLAGVVTPVTADFTLDAAASTNDISLAGVVPPVTASFDVSASAQVALAGTVGPVTGAFNASVVLPSAYSTAVLADSPTAYYRLDETSGSTMVDSSGNGNNGVYTISGPHAHGVPGLIFGDPDTTVELWNVATAAFVDTPETFSIEFLARGSAAAYATAFRSDSWYISVGFGSTIEAGFYGYTPARTISIPISKAGAGVSHYAMTVTTTGSSPGDTTTLRVYVDKVLVGSATFDYVLLGSPSNPVTIFAGNGDGLIDEVAYYENHALTGTEIADHFDVLEVGAQLAGNVPRVTSSFTVQGVPNLVLDGNVPRPTAAFTLQTSLNVSMAGVVGPVTADFTIDAPTYLTVDTSNSANGLRISGTAAVVWEPPVVPVPMTLVQGALYDTAHALEVSTVDGRLNVTATEARRPGRRQRLLVGNKDVSYFRDTETPPVEYQLQEPMTYGPATIVFPQIFPCYERIGAGTLSWLKPDAEVRVQRVDLDGNVVATDYRGFVVAFDISGATLTVQVGGMLTGRAALRNRQPPLWRGVRDAGAWAYDAVHQMNLPFEPRLGPTTGIKITSFGGVGELEYLSQLCAMAADRTGVQWTIEFDKVNLTWRMVRKDVTTIDATIYFDDARAVPNLRRDTAEEPNRIFGTGVTPRGLRVKNGVYPGLKQGEPPPFPGTLSEGDTGDGVTILIWRLVVTGYLDREDVPGGFDTDVERAVEKLQDDAGLSVTGVVNSATWDALFDLGVTGYSLTWSKILPMAERSYVKEWYRTSSGSLLSRNPNYDRHAIVRDRNVDFGSGFTKEHMREWSKTELGGFGDNWVGTIDLRGDGKNPWAVIRGEHTPGDPVPSGDVMPARALAAGDNIWAPLFAGGVLFHISSVTVSGGNVQLAVDTRARDAMKVWAIIQRDRESKRNPAREFAQSLRSSRVTKDFITFDEVGGVVDEGVHLAGGKWTQFPVVAGEEGTVRSLRMVTTPATEFAMLVTGRNFSVDRLNRMVPSPLHTSWWTELIDDFTDSEDLPWYETKRVSDWLDDHLMLYAAGTPDQPCGYAPSRKTDDSGAPTDAVLTGKHHDDAGWSYHTFAQPVLWVAVWVPTACKVKPGRVMWEQHEAGA